MELMNKPGLEGFQMKKMHKDEVDDLGLLLGLMMMLLLYVLLVLFEKDLHESDARDLSKRTGVSE